MNEIGEREEKVTQYSLIIHKASYPKATNVFAFPLKNIITFTENFKTVLNAYKEPTVTQQLYY